MKHSFSIVALSGAVSVVSAQGPYKWSQDRHARNWLPARETPDLGYMQQLGVQPVPTTPPVLDAAKLKKRSSTDNTCAYVSGDPSASLYCSADSACMYNSAQSKIGCCPDTDSKCPVFTTCYDSTDSSKFTTDNGFTLYCGSSVYPSCLKHVYADTVFFGYTLLGCGKTSGSDVVYYSATNSPGSSTTPQISPNTSPTSPTTPPTPPPTTEAASSSAAPVGAIAGGAVGGVAVIALIAAGVFLLLRRNKKHAAPTTTAPPTGHPPGSPGGVYGAQPPPEMAQQHPPQGFVPVDNRASIAKPPYGVTHSVYDPSMTSSPPSSPLPQGHSPSPPYPAHSPGLYQPTSPTATQYSSTQPSNGMGYQSGPVPSYQQTTHAAELPAQRGDGELRELAG